MMKAAARQPFSVCGAGEADMGAQLFRGAEVVARHGRQGHALDLDDALVAFHVRPLVAGEGQVAPAEQGRRIRRVVVREHLGQGFGTARA